jgi:methionine synthase I (cobalamin-dependent)
LEDVASMIPRERVDAAGIMHTRAEVVADALEVIRRHFDGPLMAYPDSGYFEMPDWRFVDVIASERFEAFCREWIGAGVRILGGCCGLTPEHIRAAARAKEAASR